MWNRTHTDKQGETSYQSFTRVEDAYKSMNRMPHFSNIRQFTIKRGLNIAFIKSCRRLSTWSHDLITCWSDLHQDYVLLSGVPRLLYFDKASQSSIIKCQREALGNPGRLWSSHGDHLISKGELILCNKSRIGLTSNNLKNHPPPTPLMHIFSKYTNSVSFQPIPQQLFTQIFSKKQHSFVKE